MKMNDRRRRNGVFTLLLIAAMSMSILVGCESHAQHASESGQDSDVAVQEAFDRSVDAEAYTQELFEAMLSEKGISLYEITLTSGGFITGETLVFVAGYRYTYDGQKAVYGYKVALNDDGVSFSVLEEGVDVGEFVVGHGDG